MAKDFIDEFTKEDFNACNMIIKATSKDKNAHYLQLHDKDKSFDKNIHYEIIYILDNDENANHEKGFVYVEIHFESEKYGRYFKSVVENLVEADPSLESFPWREYCPALRLKDTKFDTSKKKKILDNLAKLKEKTFDTLIQTYEEISQPDVIRPSFSFIQTKKNIAKKRSLNKSIREPKSIFVMHEKIKCNLISKINDNNKIIQNYTIKELSEENKVNGCNYIDLVAKTESNKFIFFEIKTAPNARLCIRQAIGQLMEYAFFPNCKNAEKLIVVGTGDKTKQIDCYIKNLNEKFNINIDYLQV